MPAKEYLLRKILKEGQAFPCLLELALTLEENIGKLFTCRTERRKAELVIFGFVRRQRHGGLRLEPVPTTERKRSIFFD